MRILFMGTPDFAVPVLEALIAAGHEIVLAVTQPDKAAGRSKALQPSPVKSCALAHGIPVFQPERVRRPEAMAWSLLSARSCRRHFWTCRRTAASMCMLRSFRCTAGLRRSTM